MERLYTGARWTEETGTVSVFRNPSANSNGNIRDKQGWMGYVPDSVSLVSIPGK
jgi:sugar lactone lactonase YvrE